jgi:ribulose-5-phosphate 4-epimerase/fuculose-1-phosphate aldolase
MTPRVVLICTAAIIAVGAAIFTGQTGQTDQALINDLVIANRILASDDLAVLRVYGHISARSRRNAGHFYIARNVAPAFVSVRDIIENDLDGKAVSGNRTDQYEERFIDAAIYRARPDAMAVVHIHSPELIAFSVSSTPLQGGGGGGATPVYDIRKFNNGRIGEITTPELGRTLAEALGRGNAILLLGHGAVTVSSSVPSAISSANSLKRGAQLQMQMIAMGGKINPNPREFPEGRVRASAQPPTPVPAPSSGGLDTRNNAGDRAWDHWKRVGAQLVQSTSIANQPQPSDPIQAIKQDLAIASRILSSPQLGIMDTAGHVSVRHPKNPNHYFISRAIAPGSVTAGDLIENDLDSKPVAGARDDEYLEVHIHGQIYKARPDVMAVIHSHTPELVAFGQTSVKLRPVSNGGAFIGEGMPLWAIGRYDPTQTIVTTPELGRSLAQTIGKRAGALLTGHGIALTDSSLYGLVHRVYDFRLNAMIQQQAILLGGNITYLEGQDSGSPPPAVVPNGSGGGAAAARFWEYWKRQVRLDK